MSKEQGGQPTEDRASVRISRGVYVPSSEAESLRVRATAMSRALLPGAVIGRRTAAWLWGIDALPPGATEAQWPVEVIVPPQMSPPRRRSCRGYQADLPREAVTEVDGVPVTTMERTALDLARYLPRTEAVAALDQFLRRGVEATVLQERAADLAGQRNAAELRDVLDAGDAGARTPGESWTRALVLAAGLPRPATQVSVRLIDGKRTQLQMALKDYTTGIEYVGEDEAGKGAERQQRFTDAGWQIVAARRDDALGDPGPFLRKLTDTLLGRGWKPSAEELDEVRDRIETLSVRTD